MKEETKEQTVVFDGDTGDAVDWPGTPEELSEFLKLHPELNAIKTQIKDDKSIHSCVRKEITRTLDNLHDKFPDYCFELARLEYKKTKKPEDFKIEDCIYTPPKTYIVRGLKDEDHDPFYLIRGDKKLMAKALESLRPKKKDD